ncbi:SMC family ATPase [Gottschalkiaceae bacterium SANA]|nr:SMC family ATPase [Gottschalkiaceae bacterium SANA]
MKLIELDLIGFGPFAKRTKIDFQLFQAAPILLIHGQTGAGKTSVLDAITYAFYGRASGMDGRTPDTLRSQLIEESDETEVQLIFELRGQRYRVNRSPEYLRKKRRGDGWIKESPRAVFEAWESDHWVPKATRTQGVNQAIEEKLGFSYEQFTQVLILPQGKFRQILIADSSQRRDIFRQLFRTGDMEWIQLRLREDTAKMRKEIETRKIRLEELFGQIESFNQGNASSETLDSTGIIASKENVNPLEVVRKQVERHRSELKEIETKLASDRDKLKESRELRELAIQAEQVRNDLESWENRLAALLGKGQEVEGMTVVRDRGERALGIQKSRDDLLQSKTRKSEVENRLQVVQREWKELLDKRKELSSQEVVQASIESLQTKIRGKKDQEKLLARALKIQKENCVLQEKVKAIKADIVVREKQKVEAEESLTLILEKIRQEKAYDFAKDLQAEQACPVCGSLHHPRLAQPQNLDPSEEVMARKRVQQSDLALRTVMDSYQLPAEKLAKLQGEEEGIQSQLKGLDGLGTQSAADLESEERSFQKQMNAVRAMDKNWARITGQLEVMEIQQRELAEETIQLQQTWDKALKQSGFVTEASYADAVRSYEELQGMNRKLQQYQLDLAEAKRKVDTLKKEVEDKYSKPIRVADQEIIVEEWTRIVEEEAQALAEEIARWKNEKKILVRLETASVELEEIETKFGSLAWMSNVASGKNAKGMDFEQYVLRRYLQEVLLVANQRLEILTDGRFELHMQEERRDKRKRFGLDLDVFDFYTGDRRPVGSLSGGESFKASLAMALALSDVVRAFSGGIELETLFIDEGFGSLDSASLDQAVEVLVDLKQQNRLVGIISHVPELKERIDNRIEVIKNRGKQGSRIRIHLPGGGNDEAMPVSNQ